MDSLTADFDREPVKLLEDRGDVVNGVQDQLERQSRVSYDSEYEGWPDGSGGVKGERWADRIYVTAVVMLLSCEWKDGELSRMTLLS